MPPASPQVLQNPERLAVIDRLHLLDTPPDPALARLTRLAAQLLSLPGAYISLVTDQRIFFATQTGLPEALQQSREIPLSHSLCQHAIESGKPLAIEDARVHPLTFDNPMVETYDCQAFLGIPLRPTDSPPVGALCVIATTPRAWTEQDINNLSDIAASVETEMRLWLQHHEVERIQSYIQRVEQSTIEFLRSATHKLLSPIHVVQGYLDMENDPAICPLKNTILESIEEMRLIIEDLMTVSQVEEITRVRDERVNLVDTARQVINRLTGQIAGRQQQLEVILPAELAVRGNREQLEEAVINLVGNASKYTPEGGSLTVELAAREGQGEFRVNDTGYGIPIEYQSSLFQPFYRVVTRETAPIKGTGLGLYLVKAIITRHGGEVFFQSSGGAGSTFGFRLPLYS